MPSPTPAVRAASAEQKPVSAFGVVWISLAHGPDFGRVVCVEVVVGTPERIPEALMTVLFRVQRPTLEEARTAARTQLQSPVYQKLRPWMRREPQ